MLCCAAALWYQLAASSSLSIWKQCLAHDSCARHSPSSAALSTSASDLCSCPSFHVASAWPLSLACFRYSSALLRSLFTPTPVRSCTYRLYAADADPPSAPPPFHPPALCGAPPPP